MGRTTYLPSYRPHHRHRDGAYDFRVYASVLATRATRPAPYLSARWGTDGHESAGLPEMMEY